MIFIILNPNYSQSCFNLWSLLCLVFVSLVMMVLDDSPAGLACKQDC